MEGILIKLINLNDRCYEVTAVTGTDSTKLLDVEVGVSVQHLKQLCKLETLATHTNKNWRCMEGGAAYTITL